MCRKVAAKWTKKENVNQFATLINDTVLNAKNLNNQITNIRHIDKFTIPVDNLSFYKMTTTINISIIELVIQSFPEDYIVESNATDIKSEYIIQYNLMDEKEHLIDTSPNPDDIPF